MRTRTMSPLTIILEAQQDIDANTDELMSALSHAAIGVNLNKPLNRGRWLEAYFIKILPSLNPNGLAFKVVQGCRKESTSNKLARCFETFYEFYWGTRPYRAARPLPGKIDRAHNRVREYSRIKKAVIGESTQSRPLGCVSHLVGHIEKASNHY